MNLEPRVEVRRQDLGERFGGSQQAGIAPLKTTPNILVFTNPTKGPEHGYYQWLPRDRFPTQRRYPTAAIVETERVTVPRMGVFGCRMKSSSRFEIQLRLVPSR
jgi:hypothetical protein